MRAGRRGSCHHSEAIVHSIWRKCCGEENYNEQDELIVALYSVQVVKSAVESS